MSRILKVVGALLLAVAAVVVVGGLVMSPDFEVERSLTIDARPEAVWAQLIDVSEHQKWSPWNDADPSMVVTLGERTSGVGATYSWTSENSGGGTYTITRADDLRLLESNLDFGDMGTAKGWWTLQQEGEATVATWGFRGTSPTPIMGPWMNLMIERTVGPMFEQGLAEVKVLAEAHAAQSHEQASDDGEPAAAETTAAAEPDAEPSPVEGQE